MTRSPFLLFLLPLSITACAATVAPASSTDQRLGFTLSERSGSDDIQADFFRDDRDRNRDRWTSTFRAGQLSGLDMAAFRQPGANAVRFALRRESGDLGCAGSGGNSRASGDCRLVLSPAFLATLAQAGIAAPRSDEWVSLFALDVRRDLIDTIRAAGYPPPSVDDLVAMTAVGVDAAYIAALARAGYRPERVDTLVELRAVGVTPEWIGSIAAAGYARLPADELVQLRALGVDGDYIRGLGAAGYGSLTADQLVEMKALGVTPDYARRVTAALGRQSPSRLVEMRALGLDPTR